MPWGGPRPACLVVARVFRPAHQFAIRREKRKAQHDQPCWALACECRQRPTLPHSFPCSTIGGSRLNFRVRNGNGCDPAPMTTGKLAAWGPRLRSLDELREASLRWLAHRSAEGAEVGSSQTIFSKNAEIEDCRFQIVDWNARLTIP